MDNIDITQMDKNTFQQLKVFSEALPVASIVYEFRDGVWSVLSFNEVICENTGYSREEYEYAVKINPWEFIHSGDLKLLQQNLDSLLKDNKIVNQKCRINGKKGLYIVNISSRVIEKTNESTVIHCIYNDITDMESEKQKLILAKEEANIIASLMERSKQFIFKYYFNSDTYILCNDFSHNFFYNINEPISLDTFLNPDVIAPESIKDIAIIFSNIKAGVPNGSAVFKAKDEFGRWQWYLVKFTTVFDNKTAPSYSIIYFRNISSVRKKGIESKRFRDFSTLGSNNVFLNITYNITLDTFEDIEGEIPSVYNVNLEYSIEKNLSIIGEKVHPDDAKDFYKFLSRKDNRLQKLYIYIYSYL